jgi:hypothetical protein
LLKRISECLALKPAVQTEGTLAIAN